MPGMQQLSDAVVDYVRHSGTATEPIRQTKLEEQLLGVIRPLAEQPGNLELMKQVVDGFAEALLHARLPGLNSPLASNFERWLSFLIESPPWLSPADQVRNRAAFLEVSQAVHTVLKGRQSLLLLSQEGNCPPWLIRLVNQWRRDNAHVLTFNYDQLVEIAYLAHAEQDRAGTRSWDLYPAHLTPLAARTGLAPAVSARYDGLQLYKLHGSLGWWYSGPDGPPGDVVYDEGVRGDSWDTDSSFAADRMPISISQDLQPMIVPPAAVKSPYYGNSLLRSIWRSAALQLKRADEVVIIGFSLPATDMLASSMLCTTLSRNSVITPVDRDEGIVDRICQTFGLGPGSERVNGAYVGDDAVVRWVSDHTEPV